MGVNLSNERNIIRYARRYPGPLAEPLTVFRNDVSGGITVVLTPRLGAGFAINATIALLLAYLCFYLAYMPIAGPNAWTVRLVFVAFASLLLLELALDFWRRRRPTVIEVSLEWIQVEQPQLFRISRKQYLIADVKQLRTENDDGQIELIVDLHDGSVRVILRSSAWTIETLQEVARLIKESGDQFERLTASEPPCKL